MHLVLLSVILAAAQPHVCHPAGAEASTASGGAYAPESAIDGSASTRWASADGAAMPQWFEVRFAKPEPIDTVVLNIPVNDIYSDWKDFEVAFSQGEPVRGTLDRTTLKARIDFEPRVTGSVRVTIHSVYHERNYVGINEILAAKDPDGALGDSETGVRPLELQELTIRGRSGHPCVNLTPADVESAAARAAEHEWAREMRDEVIAKADRWLEGSAEYWLGFLPEPGACYAYGFTGDPGTGGSFGTWSGARCSWEHPGKVRNPEGRLFPNEEYPDDGTGYVAGDGRIHYFIGIWNAWVTEQWTRNALPALSRAYLLTGDERYAERGILLLDALASIYAESTDGSWDYPSDPPSGRFARPWYQVARNLVLYVDFYDFMYNSPAMEKASLREGMSRRENIERYMLLDGAHYCYKHSFHGALHNGHADYLRGALAAGCVLNIPEYIEHAVESPFSIFTMLANNIDRDGRYYESALGYAIHARNLYLTFADPLYNLQNAEYPQGINLYDDPKMRSCLFLPDLQVEMAGRRPNFGDSGPDTTCKPLPKHPFAATDYHFLERLYARTSDTAMKHRFGQTLHFLSRGNLDDLRQSHGEDWLLWHAEDAPPYAAGQVETELPPDAAKRVHGSWVAGMKGMAMLRDGGHAAFLRFGPSLNHGDPDDLALLYYAQGYEFSYDIGYGLGSTHVHCGWASSTVSHCTVTVNETNQFKAPGSGGSLLFFGDLPSAKVVQAESKASYRSENVSEYRRTVALMTDGGYLVDVFDVAGGHRHDYGFGSIETNLEPFGVENLRPVEGSLAEGYAWAGELGNDGDIKGYPNKPYWNPPPGNGYGFFYDVRKAEPGPGAWGGTWTFARSIPTALRMHMLSPATEAVYASAPGIYRTHPPASYVLARRESAEGPLQSTFLCVYEPFKTARKGYLFDYRDLAAMVKESTAETKAIGGLGVFLLKAAKAGDSMTFHLNLERPRSGPLVIHAVRSPSYGVMRVEWDGEPVGEPVDLRADRTQAPEPVFKADVDFGRALPTGQTSRHELTVRVEEAGPGYLGLAGISFGEPDGEVPPEPILDKVTRLHERAAAIHRLDGNVDIVLAGPCEAETVYGTVSFDGGFALITGDGQSISGVECLGTSKLEVSGSVLDEGPPAFEAVVTQVDVAARAVALDRECPEGLAGLAAVFSSPEYSRTTAYHVQAARDNRIVLEANTLSLGIGRVEAVLGPQSLLSEVPHEYAKVVRGAGSTGFFDGKRLVTEDGQETRVRATKPGSPMRLEVDDASFLEPGMPFEYVDLAPGDRVRIALPRVHRF